MTNINTPILPGDAIRAEQIDDIQSAIEQARFSVLAPLELSNHAGGSHLRLSEQNGFFALLSGSSSPYSWIEKVPTGSGGWHTQGRVGTASAYEVNSVASLNGKMAWIHPNGLDYRFQTVQKGNANPKCPATIHVEDRSTGNPISGAEVQVAGTTGYTDSSGNYTCPSSGSGSYNIVVTYMGQSLTISGVADSVSYCTNPIDVCYCSAQFTVNTVAGATIEINGGEPPVYFTVSGAGTSSITYKYAELLLCTYPSLLPVTFSVEADGPSGYLSNCTSITLHCDDSQTVNLPLYYYPTCYVLSHCCPDQGCSVAGEGPSNRGLSPKNLRVKFKTTTASQAGVGANNYFGSDENQWISLNYTSTSGNVNYWSSGCRGSLGNFVGCNSGTLNGLQVGDSAVNYTNTEVFLQDCNPGVGGQVTGSLTYVRYGNGCNGSIVTTGWACPPSSGSHAGILPDSGSSGSFSDSNTNGGPVCTPVDFTVSGLNRLSNLAWTAEVQEVPCASTPPTGTTPGSGTVSSMSNSEEEPTSYPSLQTMAGNFAHAVVEHVANGMRHASPEVQEERRVICEGCPLFDVVADRCRQCGCGLALKRSWESSRCPEGKW